MPAYLIKYHRPTGALEVTEYESLIEGTRARHRLDQVNKDPDVEIVAIGAKNLESSAIRTRATSSVRRPRRRTPLWLKA